MTAPMLLVDLSETSERTLLEQRGADTALKLPLKHSRDKNFIQKLQKLMLDNSELFIPLSAEQARGIYRCMISIGQSTPENAQHMKSALQRVYGANKASKIFTLIDFYKQEGERKGMQEGIKQGMQQGERKRDLAIAHKMLARGMDEGDVAEMTGLSLEEVEAL